MKKLFTPYLLFVSFVFAKAQVPVLWAPANSGGAYNSGTIFNLHADGSNFNVAYNFGSIANDGQNPTGNMVQGPNGVLYGTTEGGGANGGGMLYSFNPVTSAYADVYDFGSNGSPWGGLMLANNGLIYGMTFGDGLNGAGNIFSLDTLNNYTDVWDFNFGDPNGCFPYGGLVQGANGALYGMTSTGGNNGSGTIFSFNISTGNPTPLYSWTGGTDGGFPWLGSSLIQAINGLLYGMTNQGGANGYGVVFSIDTLGATYYVLWSFDGSPDENPAGSLVQAGGLLYGMTNGNNCGCGNGGVLFSVDTTTTNPFPYSDLETFTTSTGDNPTSVNGTLNLASDGNLYGATTDDGTSSGDGEVFQYNYNTFSYNPLYNLSAVTADGTRPFANFLELRTISTSAINGSPFCAGGAVNVHFTATGAYLLGNVFTAQLSDASGNFSSPVTLGTLSGISGGSFTINGNIPGGTAAGMGYRIRVVSSGPNFTGADNGSNLTINTCASGPQSQLWGTTSGGGADGLGTIYSINEDGTNFTVHFAFGTTATGAYPYGNLLKATNGKLYGMTTGGGANNYGVLYSIDPQTNAYADLVDFDYATSPQGAVPWGGLVQAGNGTIYGMTYDGGAGGPPNNLGALFSFDPTSNTYTNRFNFTGTDGANPYGNLIQATNNLLYGMTTYGGALYNAGNIFSFDPANPGNPPVDLYDFTNGAPDYGYNPYGSLIQAGNGKLYGMTRSGGIYGLGNIFSFDPANPGNPPVDLYDFTGTAPDYGFFPWGGLLQASNGLLYGMTSEGGANSDGNLFSFDPANPGNPPVDLVDFTGAGGPNYGISPYGSLMQAGNGDLYGWTNIGGAYGDGVVFRYDYTTNTYLDLRDLNGNPDGMNPFFGSFTEVPASTVNTWLGGTGDWNLSTNWSLGTVPACSDVEDSIPVTANNPTISVPENASNLVIDDGVTVTVNAALDVCGNLTGGSSRAATIQGTTALTLTGTTLQTISGLIAFQNPLALDNTYGGSKQAQLASGAVIAIYNSIVLQNNNTLDVSLGTLTLKSASVTQAAIIDNFSGSNSGTVTGNITAQRYYGAASSKYDFIQHMLGSPVGGINLSALGSTNGVSALYQPYSGVLPGSPDPYNQCDEDSGATGTPYGNVFSFIEANASSCIQSGWLVDASSTPDSAGKGYSVVLGSGSGTLSLTGPANLAASYSRGTTNSGYANTTSDQGRTYTSGINLLANPYPASLDPGALISDNADFSGVVYVWNETTASYYQPATIAPFQAFKVIQTTDGADNYVINGTSRTTSTGTFQRTANPMELNMSVTNTSTGLSDETTVGFNPNSTAQFNPAFDIIKLPGALTRHTLYTVNNSDWLWVNILQSIAQTSTVPVGFEPGISGTYTANFNGINSFDATSYITLEDRKTGAFHDVRSGSYTFSSDATSDSWNRFVLHFTPPAVINTTDETCDAWGMINIEQPGTANWNYTLITSNNHTIASGILNVNNPVSVSVGVGVYSLTLTDNNGYSAVKSIEVTGEQPVYASFNISANTVDVNQELTLAGASTNAVLYSWNFGDGTTGTGATTTHSYLAEGVYNIVMDAASASGCYTLVRRSITVINSATGISNLSGAYQIPVWSNGDMVYVDFTPLKDVQANIQIYNIIGQKLCEDEYSTSTVYHKEIPNLEEGYVVVCVKNGDAIVTKKLFISNVK